MNFEELDDETRRCMLEEFQEEERENPYRSKNMTEEGKQSFPQLMEDAIRNGDESTLMNALSNTSFWLSSVPYTREGKTFSRKLNVQAEIKKLALGEFNTWYVRGFAKKLMNEKEENCQVYRADPAMEPRSECEDHENKILKVQDVYNGHRARYWPAPGNRNALSIPVGPNCHHTIRRVKKEG